MTLQTRREALLVLSAAGLAAPALLATARTAGAQTTPAQGSDQSQYVTQTLTVGTLALQTSQMAVEKAQDPMVKEFATLEVGEQKAVASVLASTQAGKTPPQLPDAEAAKVEELNGLDPGPEFDAAYIRGQIDGHNQLLEIQRSLSGENVATVEAVTARLVEQAVTSHLAMLNHIQKQLASSGGTAAGAAPAEGAAAAGGNEAPPTR